MFAHNCDSSLGKHDTDDDGGEHKHHHGKKMNQKIRKNKKN